MPGLKLLAGAALVAVMGLSAGEARAEGAWCAESGGRDAYQNCGYYTQQQCLAAVSGVGGYCRPNPYAAAGQAPGYYEDEYDEPRPRRRAPRRY